MMNVNEPFIYMIFLAVLNHESNYKSDHKPNLAFLTKNILAENCS